MAKPKAADEIKQPEAQDQGTPEAAPPAPAAAPATAPPAPESETPPEDAPDSGALRVVCRRPNAGACISGVCFASVKIGDQILHISERVDQATADKFNRVGGYDTFRGSEADHARTIEDALAKVRHAATAATPVGRAATANENELREARAANDNLARKLREANELNAAQAQTIESQAKEIDQLRNAGARSAA